MYLLFVSLIVVVSVLMILIVLIQESKGGGLASSFQSSEQFLGVKKTTDVVEKTTWGLAIAMVVISVLCAYVAPTASTSQSVLENTPVQKEAANPQNLPNFGATQQTPAAEGAKDAKEGAAKADAPAPAQTPAETPAAPAE